jgi:hypothetical protein
MPSKRTRQRSARSLIIIQHKPPVSIIPQQQDPPQTPDHQESQLVVLASEAASDPYAYLGCQLSQLYSRSTLIVTNGYGYSRWTFDLGAAFAELMSWVAFAKAFFALASAFRTRFHQPDSVWAYHGTHREEWPCNSRCCSARCSSHSLKGLSVTTSHGQREYSQPLRT